MRLLCIWAEELVENCNIASHIELGTCPQTWPRQQRATLLHLQPSSFWSRSTSNTISPVGVQLNQENWQSLIVLSSPATILWNFDPIQILSTISPPTKIFNWFSIPAVMDVGDEKLLVGNIHEYLSYLLMGLASLLFIIELWICLEALPLFKKNWAKK